MRINAPLLGVRPDDPDDPDGLLRTEKGTERIFECCSCGANAQQTLFGYSDGPSMTSDRQQFVEEFLIVVGYSEDVLLMLLGQGASVLEQDAETVQLPTVKPCPDRRRRKYRRRLHTLAKSRVPARCEKARRYKAAADPTRSAD